MSFNTGVGRQTGMPEVTEADLNFADVRATLDVLRLGELTKVFDLVVKLCAVAPPRAVEKMSEGELRDYLITCAKMLHDRDPEELKALASSLNEARQTRFKKLFDRSRPPESQRRSQ